MKLQAAVPAEAMHLLTMLKVLLPATALAWGGCTGDPRSSGCHRARQHTAMADAPPTHCSRSTARAPEWGQGSVSIGPALGAAVVPSCFSAQGPLKHPVQCPPPTLL